MRLLNPFHHLFSRIKQSINAFFKKRFNRWLSKRIPGSFQHKLSKRNIFIMPTRFGFAYLLFDVLLFLLGTNYQNNIILLLSYLLASLFISVMMHSFYNFSQLVLSSPAKQFTFAKQPVHFPINITAKKTYFDINANFREQSNLSTKVKLEQCDRGESQLLLPMNPPARGVHNLGRVNVFSEYPLGLFITWAMLDFSHQLVVFPEPKKLQNSDSYLSGIDDSTDDQNAHQNTSVGIDDFAELRSYISGESLGKIAWKQLARGQGKLSKHYQNQQGGLLWLKLSEMPSSDLETKLSFLCFLILEYGKSDYDFGLLLDSHSQTANTTTDGLVITIEPSSGFKHQQNCLIALAEVSNNAVEKS